ncbi:MAG TPA: bestrophin family ion channel [Waterburya sp.]
METKRRNGFRGALQRKGSVVPAVFNRIIVCGLFGFFVSSVHNLSKFGLSVSLPVWAGIIPTLVIGLLLALRTKAAYERYLEGRKRWGNLINTIQNQARQIWISVQEQEPVNRTEKLAAIRLLVAFAIAAKLHLRGEPVNTEVEPFLASEYYFELKNKHNPPLQIAFWIGDYLQEQCKYKRLTSHQLMSLQKLLDRMVDSLGGCERIIKTPMPLAYAIHLKQLLLIYCLSLPFLLVSAFQWFTGPAVALISFALLGIEEISSELENPFGYDDNDLPLDTSCETLLQNLEEVISYESTTNNRQLTTVNY